MELSSRDLLSAVAGSVDLDVSGGLGMFAGGTAALDLGGLRAGKYPSKAAIYSNRPALDRSHLTG